MYTSTLTTKGQATIPIFLRKKWGIKPGEKLIFAENEQGIILRTHSQLIDELAGSLKTNIKWNKKKAFKAVGEMLAQRDIRSKQ